MDYTTFYINQKEQMVYDYQISSVRNFQTAFVRSANPRTSNFEILYFVANHTSAFLFNYIVVAIKSIEIERLP